MIIDCKVPVSSTPNAFEFFGRPNFGSILTNETCSVPTATEIFTTNNVPMVTTAKMTSEKDFTHPFSFYEQTTQPEPLKESESTTRPEPTTELQATSQAESTLELEPMTGPQQTTQSQSTNTPEQTTELEQTTEVDRIDSTVQTLASTVIESTAKAVCRAMHLPFCFGNLQYSISK